MFKYLLFTFVPLVNPVKERVKDLNCESVGGEIKCVNAGVCLVVVSGQTRANVYFSEWILSVSISPRFLSSPRRFEILYVTFLE